MKSIDRKSLTELGKSELAKFNARTPKTAALLSRGKQSMIKGVPMPWMYGLYRHQSLFVTHGDGPYFFDVDGNQYLDFNVVDLAMTMGFNNRSVQDAVGEAMRRGAHFLLPIEEAIEVSEELARRTGVPFWQFTLSASGANTEVIRIARTMTKRNKILVFEGHYHGHIDDTMLEKSDGQVRAEVLGLPTGAAQGIEIVGFNDLTALEDKLKAEDIALVLTEPALSNCTLVHPEPGFIQAVSALCKKYGTLLCLDEAHTFSFAYGGLTRAWQLQSDFMVLGKGLGTGIPFALYGMTAEVATFVDRHTQIDLGEPGIAAGGTTYANTLAVLAAKTALEKILIPENYAHTEKLGLQLSNGLQAIFNEFNLPWRALHLGPRSGYCLSPQLPRTGAEAYESIDIDLISTRKLYLANRGVWDAMATAGPQVSFIHTEEHVEIYIHTAREFIGRICH
jgi:glutamate-1-semialdehyde 2,1-aminomutase